MNETPKMFEVRFSTVPGSHEARWTRSYVPGQPRALAHDSAVRLAKKDYPEAKCFEIRELSPDEVRAEQMGRF